MNPSQPAMIDGVESGADESAFAEIPETAEARPATERASILLVDDRRDKCMAMETLLAELGENIVTAHSGKDALRLLLDQDFAVILLDVNMPGLDGFETAFLIRQRKSLEHTPIIFVTGISDTETHVSRGYSLGAVDYVLTPVLPEVLRTKVSVFVELFKKNQQLKRQAEHLRQAHDELEIRVKNRTFQLAVANESLQKEIAERQHAEENIRYINTQLEQRVSERTAELVAANQELEAFTYSVAHDLQAPLRNIQSYIELLEAEWASKFPPEAGKYLARITSRTKYMRQLITGLLNLSIIGKQGLKLQQIELNGIVDEVVALLKAEKPDRRIQWKIQELPAQACDPNLMRQVFTNLLSNAVKYTQPCADAVIEVGQMKVNGETAIYVRDNGVGFNMKYADKLFGVFQRLHSVAEFEGTGIGLASVERIIRKHGGRIWAEAEEKKGAAFYFTIGQGAMRQEDTSLRLK
jgi:two-component system sensor histidine kinase/response regulator